LLPCGAGTVQHLKEVMIKGTLSLASGIQAISYKHNSLIHPSLDVIKEIINAVNQDE
jgi:hypothetical protein